MINLSNSLVWIRILGSILKTRAGVAENACLILHKFVENVKALGTDESDLQESDLNYAGASFYAACKLCDHKISLRTLLLLLSIFDMYDAAPLPGKVLSTPGPNGDRTLQKINEFLGKALGGVSELPAGLTASEIKKRKVAILGAEKKIVIQLRFFVADCRLPKASQQYLSVIVNELFEDIDEMCGTMPAEFGAAPTVDKTSENSCWDCGQCNGSQKAKHCFLQRAWTHLSDLYTIATDTPTNPMTGVLGALYLTFKDIKIRPPEDLFGAFDEIDNMKDLLVAAQRTLFV